MKIKFIGNEYDKVPFDHLNDIIVEVCDLAGEEIPTEVLVYSSGLVSVREDDNFPFDFKLVPTKELDWDQILTTDEGTGECQCRKGNGHCSQMDVTVDGDLVIQHWHGNEDIYFLRCGAITATRGINKNEYRTNYYGV